MKTVVRPSREKLICLVNKVVVKDELIKATLNRR